MKTLQDLINELKKEGIKEEILKVIKLIKREYFVLEKYKNLAYENEALPYLNNQTTSQPLVIAKTIQELELKKSDIVLEVGTGSGWQTLLLSYFSSKVLTFEIDNDIFNSAITNISHFLNLNPVVDINKIGFYNLNIFDYEQVKNVLSENSINKVVFSAAISDLPKFLIDKLENDAIIIAPVIEKGNKNYQKLMKFIKRKNVDGIYRLETEFLFYVSFVLAKEI